MSRHRLDAVRPRYGRLAAALASLVVTFVALLGGIGVLPVQGPDMSAADATLASATETSEGARTPDDPSRNNGQSEGQADAQPDGQSNDQSAGTTDDPAGEPAADTSGGPSGDGPATTPSANSTSSSTSASDRAGVTTVVPKRHRTYPVPSDSGSGRRVVFDQSQQRVWLVSGAGRVLRTYLVSGSVSDNLQPGTYQVYSRSSRAVGVDGSGTMRWFVRFTAGDSAAIGFHDIPVDGGLPVQNVSQLGTPQSHGCVRQREADAKVMWKFAPLNTWVYVVA